MPKVKTPKVYHIFVLEWSQTERETIIVEATSIEQAKKWLKRHGAQGPRYVSYYGSSEIVKAADVA